MSELNKTELVQEESGSIVQQVICRLPKKNHEAMVQLLKQFIDIFRKHGGLRYEVFQLSSTEDMADFTNMAKTVSSNQDEEEVWVEQIFFRDSKHRDEYITKAGNDENMQRLYKQFMNLITPGSAIMGEFSRLRV
jgi:uncharacterized protein YbaA (DUF1428 family)